MRAMENRYKKKVLSRARKERKKSKSSQPFQDSMCPNASGGRADSKVNGVEISCSMSGFEILFNNFLKSLC